VRIHQVTNNLI